MGRFTAKIEVLGLIVWSAVVFLAAVTGAAASIEAGSFYRSLSQPAWAPPASVFGPVWTILYGLMAVAAWLVWRAVGWQRARVALSLFLAQLGLNALWSWLFFGWKLGGAAFADITLLWALVALTLFFFWRIRALAALLLAPYLLWITFASVLNWTVWQMNPELLR